MSSASAATSSTKKVEWYHLDRVALAKRICLDNTVKLKTALNNNNNNYNSSTSISKSVKSISSSINNVSSSSPNANTTSNGNKTAYDHHRSYPRPAITGKEAFAPGSNSSGSVVGSSHAAVDPSKGIFTLRYSTTTNLTSSTAGSGSFISGSSRPSVLQQKRRRKASSRLVGVQLQKQEENQCKRFLNEDGIIVNGASSDSREDSSCGSSSRSSSSGVASDFEELETGSSSNMKMSSTARSGDCQSSSSDCEEEDEEGSTLSLVEPYAPLSKVCKNSGSNNNNNNNNLSTLNSVGGDGGNFGASGKPVMVCKGVVRIENLRTVNGKNSHKPIHNLSHGGINKIACKVESSGTSTRCKHVNGSSHSSASSTTSGSTDNDRDTDNSFSEFPPDLDFIGVSDKSKRRTDRYDSSESSDSGVATLSPSTSDSPELNSTCCDFTSEHLDVGNLISSSPSSSLSTSSSYPTTNSSSASSCSGSTLCLTEAQTETTTTFRTPAGVIEGAFPLSTSSDTGSLVTIPPVVVQDACCMWKGCACSNEASHNILEHIQTTHVAPQMKTAGYVCLWEGCKVFNKRSSSLSWLERHVLSHSGNKPFKCIFPGCGLSFSSQNALERHVNSHIATNGTTNGAQGGSAMANKKLDASPSKSSRRKKIRFRKQRINIGQRVDFFDKRIMEVIKHWLVSSVDQYAVNAHDCTFRSEIMGRRVIANCERQVLVRWHPRHVLPDEWLPESKVSKIKLVPLRQIPSDKVRLLYPALFPSAPQEKASRKRKPRSSFSPSSHSTPTHSEGSSTLSTLPPSPALSTSDIPSFVETGSFINSSSRSTRSSSSASSSSSLCSFSSFSSTLKSNHQHSRNSTSSSTSRMSDICSGIKLEIKEEEEDKCHKKFCGSSTCDCPSAVLNDDDSSSDYLDSSHWASEVLYEDMGMSPS